MHYHFALLFYFEEILYTLFKDIVSITFVCNMSNSPRASNQSLSLIEDNSRESISRNSPSSSLRPNQFVSQSNWNFLNFTFDDRKGILYEALNKIRDNFSLLILREGNEYVEWSSNTNIQFQEWWLQIAIGESILNKTQSRLVNSRWTKKINIGAQSKLWNKFVQVASTIKDFSKIICRSCHKLLNYPIAHDHSSTTNMKKHLQFTFCLERKRSRSQIAIDLVFNRVSHS